MSGVCEVSDEIKLLRRGWSRVAIARTLEVSEGAVRYHERRGRCGAQDGRQGRQQQLASAWRQPIEAWLEARPARRERLNLAALHEHLVAEHGYPGSRRSVERYFRVHYPPPARRARRRVETPPGGQAQVDWAHFGGVVVGRRAVDLWGFHLQLSWSRYAAVVCCERKDQLAWHEAHLGAFARVGGVPACVRVDNERTTVVRGAGAWGELNPSYRRFAELVRFHVDPCPPRAPQAKGKIERRIGDHRQWLDARRRAWDELAELQQATDEALRGRAGRRVCPATGDSVLAAWEQEKAWLGELVATARPFDVVVRRRVGRDATVRFEGRTYSVPFRLLEREVEIFGCAGEVEIRCGAEVVAVHRRGTAERVLIDPRHYDGPARDGVLPPPPLGRLGRRLEELAALVPDRRGLDLYAALAEAAR